jgi:hypothetical protein
VSKPHEADQPVWDGLTERKLFPLRDHRVDGINHPGEQGSSFEV